MDLPPAQIRAMVERARRYTELGAEPQTILAPHRPRRAASSSSRVHAPLIAHSARAGQFVRLLARPDGELIPLTLADWDADAGTIDLVVQAMGTSSIEINQMAVGEAFTGIAGPLGQPSRLERYEGDRTVVFTAGGVGLPPGLPDHPRAPAAGQPRDPDRRVPQR